MLLGTEVKGIVPERGKFIVEADGDEIHTDYIVNAAGLFAEKIAKMVGDDSFKITYATKGSCLILDTLLGNTIRHIVTGLNDPKSFLRWKLITPTFHDKLLIYTSVDEPAKGIEDRAVAKRIFDLSIASAKVLAPNVDFEKHIIASYSGLTARNNRNDFIIEASRKYHAFIHVALPPPGLTCSPAVSRRVVDILRTNGLDLREKADFNPYRKGIESLRRSSPARMGELIREDPRYGRVICHCERVTEGEIVEAVKRGATTLDGVKFRTRAGMGRCQANYCGPEVTKILAREMNRPFESITKKGGGSNYLDLKRNNRHSQ
jgi:glycerol-3-phosphate dehydrogenase